MANLNSNPNARYDTGPNCAGAGGRASSQETLVSSDDKGLQPDGTVFNAELRPGPNVAGAPRNNGGPNVAGAPRSYNGT